MDPKQFQYLASRLAEYGTHPVEFRTAISRAYYAAFHSGLNLLKGMGFHIVKNEYAHNEVYKHFNNSGDKDLEIAASKINNLRTKRNHADYHLERTDVEFQKNAKTWVHSAERLIENMDRSCNGKNRTQIIKAIRNWKTIVRRKP